MPSSVIAAYSYHERGEKLEIKFVSGNVYIYSGVPKGIYQKMRESRSKGIFFNQVIKGKYPFERVD